MTLDITGGPEDRHRRKASMICSPWPRTRARVFGFAQSLETVASPVSTFLIGPLAQFVTIPFMTDGAGARLIGGWFGTGPDRGMALLFMAAGLIGLVVTLLSFGTRGYRRLSATFADGDTAAAAAR